MNKVSRGITLFLFKADKVDKISSYALAHIHVVKLNFYNVNDFKLQSAKTESLTTYIF